MLETETHRMKYVIWMEVLVLESDDSGQSLALPPLQWT